VAVPTRDVFDLLRQLRHKPPKAEEEDFRKLMLAAAPVVGYNPASGLSFGVAGNAAFYKGYPETTSISSLVASLVATSKSQVLFNGKLDVSSAHNSWVFRGDNRLYWTSQKTYGLGMGTTPDEAINAKYDFFRFYETLFREIRPHLFLGAGFLYNIHRDVRPDEESAAAWPTSPYVAYSEQFGFDPGSQTSAGARVGAAWDSRDSAINPSRGLYATLDYQTFFEGFLGGSSTWQELDTELRTYVRLRPDARHRLAFWLFANLVTGGTAPYFDLPATSMDTYGRAGRGYVQGRFRGQRLAYGEVEYRVTLRKDGLLGAVAFLNTQTFSNEQAGEELFDSFATGGGVGLRLMMNKRSKTNLAFDVGWGRDGANVYFAVQEAF
jgi:outer membrane protein assembly factor BamA